VVLNIRVLPVLCVEVKLTNNSNKMQAVVSLAVPVLRYSFGIINWHKEQIKK
jgi:hypothetical protein